MRSNKYIAVYVARYFSSMHSKIEYVASPRGSFMIYWFLLLVLHMSMMSWQEWVNISIGDVNNFV